jgi:hypothetical protein
LAEGLEVDARCLEAYRAAARETGRRAARRLVEELRLGNSFQDAEVAWELVSKLSGIQYHIKREEGRSTFSHVTCPVFDAGGKRLCVNFCIPMVEGMTEELCPSCGVEIVTEAGGGGLCVKALVTAKKA